MVYRNSWLAGFAALAFAFVQLNNLLLPTAEGVAWQYIVLAALALGLTITWTALTYRLKAWLVVLLNAGAALIAIVRVATPETTAFYLPTLESFRELNTQLDFAQGLIRRGVEPVVPEAGVVVVIMIVLWAVGGLMAWGLLRGHPYVALLPPLVLSLQFATMDRRPTGATTIAAFIALVALIIFAITSDERDQTSGRMAPRGKWAPTRNRPGPAAASLLVVTIIGSVFIASAVEDTVPHDGILDWRVDSGLPSDVYGGSLSYNPFIGIRQQIVGGSQTPAFIATIVSQDVPADEVYFRFMTLEDYDGSKFSVSQSELLDLEDPVWENPDHRFAGPSALLATRVAILALDMQWLPAPAVPVAVEAISGRFGPYLRIRSEDGAILFDGGRTVNGMQYRVDASIPRPDLSVLATNQETGQLSIAFRTALEDADLPDDLVPQPVVVEVRDEPPDASRFLDLPVNDPLARIPAIADLAEEQTRNLETEFEKGIALEAFLRSFSYTTNIDPGHGAEDLAAWLLDPGSPNYRTGYCENFSTAMAVMARTLGIHSRVVLGFTPGEPSLTQSSAVIVRDRNAHAWVELWMPSQGWVRFDPTPRPDLINPSTANLSADELQFAVTEYFDDIEIPDTPANPRGESPVIGGTLPDVDIIVPPPSPIDTDTGPSLPGWVRWAAPVLVLLLLVGGGMPALKAWRHRRRLHRLRNGDVTAAWEDIVVRLGDLGRPVSPTRTPAEIASGVDEAMAPLAAVYGRAIYGPPNGGASEEEIAVAGAALADTRELLAAGTTRRQRIAAWYRPGRRVRRR